MTTKTKSGLNLHPEERFLLEKLPDVLRLEAAMKGIREKYFRLWDEICRRVQEAYPVLDQPCNHATDSYPQVGIGCKCWPGLQNWPSGFYIASIGFESFCSCEEEAPSAGVALLKRPKGMPADWNLLLARLSQQAEKKLGLKLVSWSKSYDWLSYDLPESRDELLTMVTTNQGTKFADCMISHFVRLSKLIPEVDKLFKAGKKRGG